MATCHDLVILGGGPAGLTAGLYAARSRLDVILIEGEALGGQMTTYEFVENYPGFREPIAARDLAERMVEQATRFGLAFKADTALSIEVDPDGPEKRIVLRDGEIFCRSIIVATGARPRKIGVPGERDYVGKGVSYCATCDGPFFEDQVISIVGGGDVAVEEAMYLAKFGREVNLIHRRDELRATKIIQERARCNPKIRFIMDSAVTRISGDGLVNAITVSDVKTGKTNELATDGVFIFCGTRPASEFLAGVVAVDEAGFVLVNKEMETSVPGIFAAGDVTAKRLRQIASSVGDGSTAASNAEKYVESLRGCRQAGE
jgi:thioredoxin reductase (NADPH)